MAAFRLAEYWLVSRSIARQRELVRSGQDRVRAVLGIPDDTNQILPAAAHGFEAESLELLRHLGQSVPSRTVPGGVPGWVFLDAPRIINLMYYTGQFIPHCAGVERVGSDGCGLDTSVAVGPELPSSSCHILSISLAGSQYLWGCLVLAAGFRHTDKDTVLQAMRSLHLPAPRRARIFVADQGELNPLVDSIDHCLHCGTDSPRDVRCNDVHDLIDGPTDPADALNLAHWPKLASAMAPLHITHLDDVVAGPLHWLCLVMTAYLKHRWADLADWVRQVPECRNLSLEEGAPGERDGVRQQRQGISIRAVTELLKRPDLLTRVSAAESPVTVRPPTRGRRDVRPRTTSDRRFMEACRTFRRGTQGWEGTADTLQQIVDWFFCRDDLARSVRWTKGMHVGLHVPCTLKRHGLVLSDIFEQSIEHVNQSTNELASRYSGDGLMVVPRICTTPLLLEAGAAVVRRRAVRVGARSPEHALDEPELFVAPARVAI